MINVRARLDLLYKSVRLWITASATFFFQFEMIKEVTKKVAHGKKNHKISCHIVLYSAQKLQFWIILLLRRQQSLSSKRFCCQYPLINYLNYEGLRPLILWKWTLTEGKILRIVEVAFRPWFLYFRLFLSSSHCHSPYVFASKWSRYVWFFCFIK